MSITTDYDVSDDEQTEEEYNEQLDNELGRIEDANDE